MGASSVTGHDLPVFEKQYKAIADAMCMFVVQYQKVLEAVRPLEGIGPTLVESVAKLEEMHKTLDAAQESFVSFAKEAVTQAKAMEDAAMNPFE